MRNARMTICLMVATLVLGTGQGFAETYLQDGGTYNITTEILVPIYVDLVMPENPTTVNILDGAKLNSWPVSIQSNNYANINVSGGNLGGLYANDNSNVNISGGIVYSPQAYDNSRITVSSGGRVGDIHAYDNSTVISSSGADTLRSYDNSTIEIHATFNDSAHAYGNSKLYLYGINGYELQSFDSSTVKIISGNYGYRSTVSSYGTSAMNVFGGRYVTTELTASNFSTMNLTDVHIESPSNEDDFHSGITAIDNSTVNIDGGSFIGSLVSANASTVNIYGGSFFPIDHSWIGPQYPYCGGVYTSGTSTMNIFGGYIDRIDTYSDSTVNISGGRIGGEESFHIFGGLYVHGNSNVNILDGYVNRLFVDNNGSINVSGGSISELYAMELSTIIFDGYDFNLGVGLLWDVDGGTILGTGILTGKWFDGTSWSVNIMDNYDTSTIMAIPEPTTLALFGLGGLLLGRKKK